MSNRWYKKRVVPKRYVYHITCDAYKGSIEKNGLTPKSCAESKWGFRNQEGQYPPMVFANNTEVFYEFFYFNDPVRSCHDYDIWRIDTEAFDGEWFIDLNYEWGELYVCTPNHIPKEALTQMQIAKGFCRICDQVYDWSVVSQVFEPFEESRNVDSDKVFPCCFDKFSKEIAAERIYQIEEFVERHGRYRIR
jgi:hypothetical protein